MSTYDLKLIRPDIEGRVRIQLAFLVDLYGIEEEIVDSVEFISQSTYFLKLVGYYDTNPFFMFGTFHTDEDSPT